MSYLGEDLAYRRDFKCMPYFQTELQRLTFKPPPKARHSGTEGEGPDPKAAGMGLCCEPPAAGAHGTWALSLAFSVQVAAAERGTREARQLFFCFLPSAETTAFLNLDEEWLLPLVSPQHPGTLTLSPWPSFPSDT